MAVTEWVDVSANTNKYTVFSYPHGHFYLRNFNSSLTVDGGCKWRHVFIKLEYVQLTNSFTYQFKTVAMEDTAADMEEATVWATQT
jgi:hypothetical protein